MKKEGSWLARGEEGKGDVKVKRRVGNTVLIWLVKPLTYLDKVGVTEDPRT